MKEPEPNYDPPVAPARLSRQLRIRASAADLARWKAAAKATGRPLSSIARQLLNQWAIDSSLDDGAGR